MNDSGVRLWLRALVFFAGALPFLTMLVPASRGAMSQVFASVCHQLPERTLTVAGVAMLVCSRCAGLYAGVMLGAIAAMPQSLYARLRPLLIVVALVAIAEVVVQDLHWLPLSHARRLVTGFLLGWAPAAALSRALATRDGDGAPKIA